MTAPRLLAMARVARAHAVRGWVQVVPFNPDTETLPAHVWVAGVPREIVAQERVHKGLLVHFQGIDDRNAADALRGHEIQCDRADLPEPDEGEVYAVDLAGLEAFTPEGGRIGAVVRLDAGAAHDLLVLDVLGVERLVPYVPNFVKSVDMAARRMVLELPEGLLDV